MEEALEICEKSWEACVSYAVAVACLDVLRNAKGSPDQQLQVERRIKAAIEKNRNSVPLLLVLADLQEQLGRFDDAAATDRAVLVKDPTNVVALNNLAVILAWKNIQLGEALELVQRALTSGGPSPVILDTRAVVYLRQGKADLAIARPG